MKADATLASMYSSMRTLREPYLTRARDASYLTLPTLFTDFGTNGSTRLNENYQSIGARGVNTLAAKIVAAIFPPNLPFFKLSIDEIAKRKLVDDVEKLAEIDSLLSQQERVIFEHLESSNLRSKLTDVAKQLVVGGNSLVFIKEDNSIRVFTIEHYVTERDGSGNLLKIIVKESISRKILEAEGLANDNKSSRDADLYTAVFFNSAKKGFDVYQELDGLKVTGSDGFYPKELMPWLALRFYTRDGEHYGRSYVDELMGDLRSSEGLTRANVQAAAAASKIVGMVKPNSLTSKRALNNAKNGEFVDGDASDVSFLQLNKGSDFQVSLNLLNEINGRLSYAFLMNSAIQRNAERVTAEEIRTLSAELETTIAGIFSLLGQEFQRPFIRVVLAQMQEQGKLPPLPKDLVTVKIATGTEAIGRGLNSDKLKLFLGDIVALGTPAFERLNIGNLIKQLATSRGIDTAGLVKTEEEIQQEQQQAQMQALLQQAGPGLIQQAGGQVIDAVSAGNTIPTEQ